MPGKFIGIINFNKSSPKLLIESLVELHYRIIMINSDQPYYELVSQFSHISHWILVGDDFHLYNKSKPLLDMELFTLDKHFLLTSYLMNGFLQNKGMTIKGGESTDYIGEINICTTKHDLFDTLPKKMNVYRKHKHYFKEGHDHLEILNTHKKQIMTAIYSDETTKNPIILLQWQPEKTTHGIIFLNNWIH
jgi:hypothetical protein